MAILKCKMCGGDLSISEGMSVCECEYCGSMQTVPSADNEKKLALFTRANKLRFGCEFDKAAGVYETIVADFPEEAEAYWGLVLCKYGIEYVDDPATGKKIPTCHRSSFESVMDDSNFELVMENANTVSRGVYREEAKQIEELRKGIIEVSSKEEPYDIFICYKESDEKGDRTVDSVIAQDVYTELTSKGYRVFFSRITLEDKLGKEYEPYIFAALNSAKIMLAFGTNYEYYNAVWVKNEWSRFLQLIAKGEKKTLIPCYKGIDAYDMPKEFARLQAQDMGKVGATQDLLRGIEKILPKTAKTEQSTVQQTAAPQSATTETLLKRAFLYLEDGNWQSADEYCEKVLDIQPENANAYFCKLLAELKLKNQNELMKCDIPLENFSSYQKALRFGDSQLVNVLQTAAATVDTNHKQKLYDKAVANMHNAVSYSQFQSVAKEFQKISGFKDADELAERCMKSAANASKDEAYAHASELLAQNTVESIGEASNIFFSIAGYKDAEQKVYECKAALEKIKADVEKYWKGRFDEAFDEIAKEKFSTAAKLICEIEKVAPNDARVYIGRLLINYKVKNEKELSKQALRDGKSLNDNKYYKKIIECGDDETVARFEKIAKKMKTAKRVNRLVNLLIGIMYLVMSALPAIIMDRKDGSRGFWEMVLYLALPVIAYTVIIGLFSHISKDRYAHWDYIMSFFFISIITDAVLFSMFLKSGVIVTVIFNKIVQGIVGFLGMCFFVKFENFEDIYNNKHK